MSNTLSLATSTAFFCSKGHNYIISQSDHFVDIFLDVIYVSINSRFKWKSKLKRAIVEIPWIAPLLSLPSSFRFYNSSFSGFKTIIEWVATFPWKHLRFRDDINETSDKNYDLGKEISTRYCVKTMSCLKSFSL